MTTSSRERWLSEWEEPAGSPTAMVTFQDEAWLQRFGLPNESNVVDYLRPSAFMPTTTDEELVVDRQATVPSRDAAQPDTLVVRRRNANDETLAMCVARATRRLPTLRSLPHRPHVPSPRPRRRQILRSSRHRTRGAVCPRTRRVARAEGCTCHRARIRPPAGQRRAVRLAAEAVARAIARARARHTARDANAPPPRSTTTRPSSRPRCASSAPTSSRRAAAGRMRSLWPTGVSVPPRDDEPDADDGASARVPPAHRGAAWRALETAVSGVREIGIDEA